MIHLKTHSKTLIPYFFLLVASLEIFQTKAQIYEVFLHCNGDGLFNPNYYRGSTSYQSMKIFNCTSDDLQEFSKEQTELRNRITRLLISFDYRGERHSLNLPDDIGKAFPNVITLLIHHAEITENDKIQTWPSSLTSLSIYNSRSTYLPMLQNSSISSLEIQRWKNLASIENIKWLTKLQKLAITSCKSLTSISEGIFSKNGALIKLILADNGIKKLHSTSLDGLIDLEQLDISKNPIEEMPVGFFDNAPMLQKVTWKEDPFCLNGTRIWPNEMFTEKQKQLTTFKYSMKYHSKCIFEFNHEAFSGPQFRTIEKLTLQDCDLDSSIFNNFIPKFERITDLDLAGNNINRLKNIPKTLRKIVLFDNDIDCLDRETYETFKSIENIMKIESDFHCKPPPPPEKKVLVITERKIENDGKSNIAASLEMVSLIVVSISLLMLIAMVVVGIWTIVSKSLHEACGTIMIITVK